MLQNTETFNIKSGGILVCSFEIKFCDYQFFVLNYVIQHVKHILSWDKLKQIFAVAVFIPCKNILICKRVISFMMYATL
jgi:hypothetical protein